MMRKLLTFARAARKSIAILVAVLVLAAGGFSTASYATNNNHHKAGHTQYAKWQPAWWHNIWKHFRKKHKTEYSDPVGSCGYAVRTGTYSIWHGGYQAWVDVKNVEGETATDFEVLIDIGNATLVKGHLAEYEQVEDGYMVSAPFWLQWQQIPQGSSYRFQFIGKPYYDGVTPYVISINGVTCDTEQPEISLAASGSFFYAEDTLTLTAEATDNVAVHKVVFMQGGEVIAEDSEAPYELEIDLTDALNGNHLYTATAYDPTGNEASAGPARVFVSIGDKFFGTAPSGGEDAPDYADLLTYFNQLTPENASKWGSVEAERDVMNWNELDVAYNFARANNIRFKFHTLVWGQQAPGWIGGLSAEEQLEEINEWMAAVAERYQDIEMIDVVNEPLHAPPSYMEALGGQGTTGWDWVITAFEMAREYFPAAQLILNDYQILHLPNFTQDYLVVINLLQERGLIDAIGVQAHFLERTQGSMVQTNLDTLAETGLPIYASELDLNFENDAQQANVMRDLFTVLWNHPAVAGITHWGHLEGDVWLPYTYLIREDGSTRPAMNWIQCYIGGGADCDSLVPEYIPSGWQGDEFGVTLEAELYDEGEGLVALGSVVAFTNPGDWIVFRGVEFQDGWDKLWVTYARGLEADNGATITVHIESLENPPVQTIPMPYTGGWGVFDTLEIDWTPISTTEDVFIRFNEDEEAVGNLDNIRFGRPQPVSEINLVGDGGFEGATLDGGWGTFGNSSVFTLVNDPVHTGGQSLQITGRTGTGGFAAYWLTDKVSTGTSYAVSTQVFQAGAGDDTVRMVALVGCDGEANAFNWLDNNTAVPAATWTKLSGLMVIPDGCDITEVQLFFEATAETTAVYLDEIKVTPLNMVGDGGFEGPALVPNWSAFGSDTVLSLTGAQFNGGAQSMLADRTTGTGGFAAYWLTDFMTPGLSYLASAQVFQTGAGDDTVRMVALVGCDGEADDFQWIENNTAVPADTWTPLSGAFSIPLDCDVTQVQLYFEGTAAGVDVYIDDVSVNLPAANLVSNGDFESDTSGWGVWFMGGTALSTSSDYAVTGSQSLLASSRIQNSWPSYALTGLVEAGTTYTVVANALHTGGANDRITLTALVTCGGAQSFNQIQDATDVAPETWTELTGSLNVPAGCDVGETRIYFENTTAGVDLYIDDVSVIAN